MAQILTALNFGEMGALKSAKNSDFFHVKKNIYAQFARNFITDQPPPPFLGGTRVTKFNAFDSYCIYYSNNQIVLSISILIYIQLKSIIFDLFLIKKLKEVD